MSIEGDAAMAASTLRRFVEGKRLPIGFFEIPDNVVIRANDVSDFYAKAKYLEPQSKKMTLKEETEGRYLLSAKLVGGLAVNNWGRVNWVDIIEPFSEEIDLRLPRSQQMKFFFEDLINARQLLEVWNIPHTFEIQEHNEEINVIYDRFGNNFSLTNKSKDQIVQEQIREKEVRVLKDAA